MSALSTPAETGISAAALAELIAICGPARTLTRRLERVAYASDASFYHLVPAAVLQPRDVDEVRQILDWSRRHGLPITLRTAGTSLSGQAITDGLLLDLSKHWRGVEILKAGAEVWVQPGVIGGHVNTLLRPLGRKIGPDPASIQACMLGGILANNASGMCCGVSQNAYHTLKSLAFLLPNGYSFDTAAPEASRNFAERCPELHAGLAALRRELLAQPALCEKIRAKYRQKNTMGYSLNALLDYEDPLQILAHLLIGSEGTLAMITEAVLTTLPDKAFKYTGLLIFDSLAEACGRIEALAASGAAAIELLDDASLRALPAGALAPQLAIVPDGTCALLTEYQAEDLAESRAQAERVDALMASLPLLAPPRFSFDPKAQAGLWKLRKGLYPSIGAARQSGNSVLIEDVVFPLSRLAQAVGELQTLFARHGYPEAIIFGHAKDGNLHFVITPSLQSQAEIQRYDGLMRDLCQLVLGLGGALKAEHGTGRNMAPFVAAEWGPEAYAIMQKLKALIDPEGLLNPGVILNASPQAHLEHLKPLPSVDAEVDKCTECGFCEPVCPSRRVTLTPRQRIVLRRERQRLLEAGDSARLAELEADYQYPGIETCAADSLCSLACPIGIDTGALIKRLRSEAVPDPAQRQVEKLSRRFGQLEKGLKLALGSAHLADKVVGQKALNWLIERGENLTGSRLPHWDSRLPPANFEALPETSATGAAFVYFPSCLNRTMGYAGELPLPQLLVQLCLRAGIKIWLPTESVGQCCGLPFSSKGFAEAGKEMARRSLTRCWAWSRHGKLPVVMDTTPCTFQLIQALAHDPEAFPGLKIIDAVSFAEQELAPRLPLRKLERHTVLHPVCSLRKLGLEGELTALAARCSSRVSVPPSAGCCGYAGDRGLLFPELPAAALTDEKREINELDPDVCCSSSRSCEMGLSLELERPFVSILHLLAASLEDPQ